MFAKVFICITTLSSGESFLSRYECDTVQPRITHRYFPGKNAAFGKRDVDTFAEEPLPYMAVKELLVR